MSVQEIDLRIVLVGSLYERNIGASSRAMANMGAEQLILVRPQTTLGFEAQQAAATGQRALQNRKVYPHWQDFFASEPDGLRIAFSARDGKGRHLEQFKSVLTNSALWDSRSLTRPVYFIFGPEDWGLSNEDIDHCHRVVCLPIFGENPSLNLAQAVLMALVMFRLEKGGKEMHMIQRSSQYRKSKDLVEPFPDRSLRRFLTEMGLQLDDRRVSAYTVFKRLLIRAVPTEKESRILHTVFEQAAHKLADYQKWRKEKKHET